MVMCRCNVIPQGLGGVGKGSEMWRCSRSSHSACGRLQDGPAFELFLILGVETRRIKV
jgi:hypothetical protein